jgi:EAL domain-containing protein (putative c-di-GMP-specific phosphodiesterase class I)
MPLRDLTEYFNQRISEEQNLAEFPLCIRAGQVEGRAGGLRLASEFHPIRRANIPSMIMGHDATLRAFAPDTSQSVAAKIFHLAEAEDIINLDRLCRIIHMLNYLPIAHENGSLFLHVHPRHVLGVKRDHGAYFEEVIFRCGLSPRQVVISVAISPLYDRQFTQLLDGLNNYRKRGYSTAIKFDEQSSETFEERYCIELLHRITPDFVRLGGRFFSQLHRSEEDHERETSLLSVIYGLDTELLVEGIRDETDALLAGGLRPAYVKGDYYEQAETPLVAKGPVKRQAWG